MPPIEWLKRFLADRSLAAPDARPLYRYRMQDDEYKALQQALKNPASLGIANIYKYSRGADDWYRAFVIYAAEWWRREYDGGSWRWEPLFAACGAEGGELTSTQRSVLVEKGLRYWRREVRVINGRTIYLGTIATEGGLPLNQLKQVKNDWLSRVFKQVIPKYARLQQTGIEVNQLFTECDFIPKNYQNSQIHAILGDMVVEVVSLKHKHKLQDHSNPVAYLDQAAANWRDNFPLPMGNDIAARLLSDMIDTAAKADETLTLPMRCIRRLTDEGGVQLLLELAGFVALSDLKIADSENLPGRLELDLVDSGGKSKPLGVALKTDCQGKPSLKMPKPPAAINADDALLGYAIRFKHLSETIKEIPLIGGEALADDVPWAFVQREGQWDLVGLASVSTRAQKVRVLYPDDWACQPEVGQILSSAFADKILREASEPFCLTDREGNRFSIKIAQSHASAYYFLEGRPLPFASVPKETYLGLPVLRYADIETGSNKTLGNKLNARPMNSKSAWQPLNANMQGVYELRYCENNAIVFRKKCVLLPDDFAVRFQPSQDSLDGTIFLEHIGTAKASGDPSIKHTITPENNGYKLDLIAGDNPPGQVRVALYWPSMTDMLTLSLPFPARGGQVIDADDNRWPNGQPLFQDQLHGIRLRLFNENPDHKRHLQIELWLVDQQWDDTRDVRFRDETKRKGPVIELAVIDYLDWIKTLLAVSGNLDGTVQLSVYENGSELLKVKIARYAYSLQRNLAQGTIELSQPDHASLSYDALTGINLMAMRLSQPEQKHIELEAQQSGGAPTGNWCFQPEKREAEPWLIYPAQGSRVALRPILWVVGYQAGQNEYHHTPDTQTLHSAVKIGHNETRRSTIKAILSAMSHDFNHSGWDYLRQLWKDCPHLPLSSFDVWTNAVTDSQVLAALVLQMDTDFIDKLNAELPVFWELLPLSAWLAVYSAYRAYLRQVMDDDDVNDMLAWRIDKISAACPSLDVVAKLLKLMLCGTQDQDLQIRFLPPEQFIQMLGERRQELDRRQADSEWPTLLQAELRSAWQQLTPAQQLGINLDDIPQHHHPIVILPLLLAAHCANGGQTNTWLGNPAAIFKLKRLKNFDEDWFNTVFKWALAYLSQQSQ